MDAIDAIIVRHQRCRETNPLNAKRKAKAVSFEATRQQERCEGVVTITTKLIARQQLLLQVRQLPQNKHDKHSHEAR
jgi:hypothetical protein